MQDVALNRNEIASGAKNTLRENLVCGDVYSHPPLNASKKVQKLQSMRYLRDKSGGDSIVWACNFKPIGVHF